MPIESTFGWQLPALAKASQSDVHNFLGLRPVALHSIPKTFLHLSVFAICTSIYLKVFSPASRRFCPSFVIELRAVRQVRTDQYCLIDSAPFLAATCTTVPWQALGLGGMVDRCQASEVFS